jgi:hypothetical protein
MSPIRRPLSVSVAALLVSFVLTAGCGSHHTATTTPSSSTSSQSSLPSSVSASPSPSTSPSPAPPSPTVPAVKAASVTFVSPSEAFVLGTAKSHGTLLVRTLDRGASWRLLSAPAVPLGRAGQGASSAVWGVRFANAAHGFVFGTGLWETTDGGLHWSSAAAPKGEILSLACIRGQVLALVAAKPQTLTASLYRRPLAGGAWMGIADSLKRIDLSDPTDLISTQAGTAAVLDGSGVIITRDGGLSDALVSTPTTVLAPFQPTNVAVTSARSLALLEVGQGYTGHTDKLVYTSSNGGLAWAKAGKPSNEGDGGTLAAGSPTTLILATASAASWLDRSADGGHTWKTVLTYGDGGLGWADLGFTTVADAVVIHGPADAAGNSDHRLGQLLLSSDGGLTWHQVKF